MSVTIPFQVASFTIDGQHIREYRAASAGSQEQVFQLEVKRYRPLDNLNPSPGDVTIIGAHGNGFPKELYESVWEEIYSRLSLRGQKIRAIWIADIASQGASGVLNENILGNDRFDHSRDLLHMINHFREDMQQPLVGVGHSMGACHLVQLALIHPRLMCSLVLIDPIIQLNNSPAQESTPAALTVKRRDIWPSQEAAEIAFRRNPFYKRWHPAVLDKWLLYGFRKTPTVVYPHSGEEAARIDSVTLKTTKHQESFMYLRPAYGTTWNAKGQIQIDRSSAPDLDPEPSPIQGAAMDPEESVTGFYRPEAAITFRNLPHLRPSVLYIFGGKSPASTPDLREAKMKITGVGVGGSGGAMERKVQEVVLPSGTHLLPMELVSEVGGAAAGWIAHEVEAFLGQSKAFDKTWGEIPLRQKQVLNRSWIDALGNGRDGRLMGGKHKM